MPEPKIKVIGAYKYEYTQELFEQAFQSKYRPERLTKEQVKQAREYLKEELGNIALLELLVENADAEYDAGDFSQLGTDQAAYNERYLDTEGKKFIADAYKTPKVANFRVLFFLHFFYPAQPLKTSYGEIPVPPLQPMPKHLAELMPYEYVD